MNILVKDYQRGGKTNHLKSKIMLNQASQTTGLTGPNS